MLMLFDAPGLVEVPVLGGIIQIIEPGFKKLVYFLQPAPERFGKEHRAGESLFGRRNEQRPEVGGHLIGRVAAEARYTHGLEVSDELVPIIIQALLVPAIPVVNFSEVPPDGHVFGVCRVDGARTPEFAVGTAFIPEWVCFHEVGIERSVVDDQVHHDIASGVRARGDEFFERPPVGKVLSLFQEKRVDLIIIFNRVQAPGIPRQMKGVDIYPVEPHVSRVDGRGGPIVDRGKIPGEKIEHYRHVAML